MSADMKERAPRRIDWERRGAATDAEVVENIRAVRAEIVASWEYRNERRTPVLAVKAIDEALGRNDLPYMRHMLNDMEWRLWR